MAEIVKNEKGFKVISCSMSETTLFGGMGICDFCSNASFNGYLVCVLNRWYCNDCYQEWTTTARFYQEDASYELSKFNYYKGLLNPSQPKED